MRQPFAFATIVQKFCNYELGELDMTFNVIFTHVIQALHRHDVLDETIIHIEPKGIILYNNNFWQYYSILMQTIALVKQVDLF